MIVNDPDIVALPTATGAKEGIVSVLIKGRTEILGRVPPGYEPPYWIAADRGVKTIPMHAWETAEGPVVDLLMGATPSYGP